VIKNPGFISLLVIFTIPPMALMAFLAAGAYIYIDGFGLSEQMFSYAFVFNALFASIAPIIYIKLSKKIAVEKIISTCFILLMLCGLLTYTIGHVSPYVFALLAAPATVMVMTTRIPGANLMLNQQINDTGSTVAIIQFFSMMSGSLGMMLVSLRPDSLIQNLGMIQFGVGAIACLLWLMVKNRSYVTDNIYRLK
jgi:DHA1 family bicyclomycin/chloramphenicol resistance-like MFS transporter